MQTKPCIRCGTIIVKSPSRSVEAWNNRTKYCSKLCQYASMKGKRYSPLTEFKKGQVGQFKGKKRPEFEGEKHPNWKGNEVGYTGLHMWVRKNLGAPKKCSNCGTTKARKYEWACIKHQYSRDLNNWRRLCTTCHRNYDYGNIILE